MRASIIAMALLAVIGAAFADAVRLPLTRQPLETSRVELELHDAIVTIAVDDLAEPSLEVLPRAETDEIAVVLLSEEGSRLGLVQPYGAERHQVPLSVRLVLRPGQRITISGRDLDVSITDRREELAEQVWAQLDQEVTMDRAKAKRPGGAASRFSLDLQDSAITMRNTTGGTISGVGNNVLLDRCRGPFVFDVSDSEVEVDDHWGSLYLRGLETGFTLGKIDGRIDLGLEASDLITNTGRGTIGGTVVESSVTVTGWHGPIDLQGEAGQVTAQRLSSEADFLTVRGSGHQVLARDLAGALRADLSGGRLEAQSVAGRAIIKAEQAADVQVGDLGDSLSLELSGGSFAMLERVQGDVAARVMESELTASEVKVVELQGRDAIVSLAGITSGLTAEMSAVLFDAELAERFSPDLSFSGESEVRIGLPTPCSVKLRSGSGRQQQPSGLSLGPCEVMRRRSFGRARGGPPPVTVRLDMGGDARVEFWGR